MQSHQQGDQSTKSVQDDDVTWLDKLPTEIIARLAKVVQFQQQLRTPDLLSLAETSPKQKEAVLGQISYRFVLGSTSKEITRRWVDVIKDKLRWLRADCSFYSEVNRAPPVTHDIIPGIVQMPPPPSRKISVINGADFWSCALLLARGIEQLEVCLTKDPGRPLIDLLKRTTASKVKLICWRTSHSRCPLRSSLAELPPISAKFAQFSLACSCPSNRFPLWEMLPLLPTLTQVELSEAPPEDAYPLLCKLKSVKMKLPHYEKGVTERLAPALTSLELSDLASEAFAAEVLACPRLTDLTLKVDEGEDRWLEKIGSGLPSLKILHIWWRASSESMVRQRGRLYHLRETANPTPGVVLAMVEALPNLSSVTLEGVRIGIPDLHGILKHCGRRLEVLSTCVSGQVEPEWTRLAAILTGVAKYNPKLNLLWISDFQDIVMGNVFRYLYDRLDSNLLKEEAEKLRNQIRHVQRCAPFLILDQAQDFTAYMIRLAERG